MSLGYVTLSALMSFKKRQQNLFFIPQLCTRNSHSLRKIVLRKKFKNTEFYQVSIFSEIHWISNITLTSGIIRKHFYILWKHQKTKGFLTISWDVEMFSNDFNGNSYAWYSIYFREHPDRRKSRILEIFRQYRCSLQTAKIIQI